MQTEDEAATQSRVTRRELLKRGAAAGAATAVPLGLLAPGAAAGPPSREFEQLKTLTTAEAATLEAIVERLIPSDATGPGAKEAGVINYIDGALAGDLRPFHAPYSAALASVDAYSQATYGATFVNLTTAKQDAVVTAMDTNSATGFDSSAKAAFEMIRAHAVEGMFGDPYHGGNKKFVGWDLVNFPGLRLTYTAKDQQLNSRIKLSRKSVADFPNFGLKKKKGA